MVACPGKVSPLYPLFFMILRLISGSKQWGQVTLDWNLWNCEPTWIFLPLNHLSWFSQVFFHSDGKLTGIVGLLGFLIADMGTLVWSRRFGWVCLVWGTGIGNIPGGAVWLEHPAYIPTNPSLWWLACLNFSKYSFFINLYIHVTPNPISHLPSINAIIFTLQM